MQYKVRGVDRQTGKKLSPLVIEAENEEAALEYADRQGFRIEQIAEAGSSVWSHVDAKVFSHRPLTSGKRKPQVQDEGKYESLKYLSALYRLAASFIGFAACFAAIAGLFIFSSSPPTAIAVIVGSIIFGVLFVITLLASAEGIRLMIDIAANLREIRDRLPPIASSETAKG